jgi:hypothetical protein
LLVGGELGHAWVYLNVDVFGATQAEIQGITSIATSPGCRSRIGSGTSFHRHDGLFCGLNLPRLTGEEFQRRKRQRSRRHFIRF